MKATLKDILFNLMKRPTEQKVKFRNRYGIELAGDLYTPKNASGKLLLQSQ